MKSKSPNRTFHINSLSVVEDPHTQLITELKSTRIFCITSQCLATRDEVEYRLPTEIAKRKQHTPIRNNSPLVIL